MVQEPGNSDPRVIEVIKRATGLHAKGETDAALQVLKALIEEFPRAASLPAYGALFLSRVGRVDEAIEYGRRAVQLSPESEKASFVLFECLCKAGLHVEALDEVKRLLALRPSEEYARMIRDWDLSEADPQTSR